jgi:hypothetical protein
MLSAEKQDNCSNNDVVNDNNIQAPTPSRAAAIRRTVSGMIPTRSSGRKTIQSTRSAILLEPGCCDDDRATPILRNTSRIWNLRRSAVAVDEDDVDGLLYQLEGGLVGQQVGGLEQQEIPTSSQERGGVNRCNSSDSTSAGSSTMSTEDYAAAGLSSVDASDNYLWSN